MIVVSLFDGMSCGRQALERVGIPVEKYFASEVDKHAIKVTQTKYPNTIQLGSVVDVYVKEIGWVDMLIGGSPCQSFSFAGKRKGMSTKDSIEILKLDHYLQLKSEGYEFEGQSYLFWEYMRVLTELRKINPNIKFLLENVVMGEKWEKVLSKAIGVNPIKINSALVSAQNRNRLYWTNIGMKPGGLFRDMESIIEQPKDKGILLKDILETDVPDKYYLSEKMLNHLQSRNNVKIRNENELSGTLTVNREGKQGNNSTFIDTSQNRKSRCFTAGGNSGGLHSQMDLVVHNTMPRNSKTGKGGTGPLSRNDGKTYCLDTNTNTNTNAVEIVAMRGRGENNEQQLEKRKDGKTNTITSVQKDNLVIQLNPSKESGGKQPYQQNRVYDVDGISPALCREKADIIISGTLRTHNDGNGFREVISGKGGTIPARAREDGSGQNVVSINNTIRRLTPIECCRLQTVSDDYFFDEKGNQIVSDTQVYKMLGNGWTIDVIAHIFNYLK